MKTNKTDFSWVKKIKNIFKNFSNKSDKEKITIVILIGVLILVIMIPTGKKESVKNSDKNNSITDSNSSSQINASYEEYLEEKLKNTLQKVNGVGAVEVAITLKNSNEEVLAKNVEASSTVTEEKDSSGGTRLQQSESNKDTYIYYDTNNGQAPYIVRTDMPQVEGVIVVAKGGGDGYIAAEITAAIEALLDIPAHKIKVLKMS